MIPTPIPDELVLPGSIRRTFTAPTSDELLGENVEPCEALVSRDPDTDLAKVQVRLVLEDGELAAINAGQPVWLTMLGGLAPFNVQVHA